MELNYELQRESVLKGMFEKRERRDLKRMTVPMMRKTLDPLLDDSNIFSPLHIADSNKEKIESMKERFEKTNLSLLAFKMAAIYTEEDNKEEMGNIFFLYNNMVNLNENSNNDYLQENYTLIAHLLTQKYRYLLLDPEDDPTHPNYDGDDVLSDKIIDIPNYLQFLSNIDARLEFWVSYIKPEEFIEYMLYRYSVLFQNLCCTSSLDNASEFLGSYRFSDFCKDVYEYISRIVSIETSELSYKLTRLNENYALNLFYDVDKEIGGDSAYDYFDVSSKDYLFEGVNLGRKFLSDKVASAIIQENYLNNFNYMYHAYEKRYRSDQLNLKLMNTPMMVGDQYNQWGYVFKIYKHLRNVKASIESSLSRLQYLLVNYPVKYNSFMRVSYDKKFLNMKHNYSFYTSYQRYIMNYFNMEGSTEDFIADEVECMLYRYYNFTNSKTYVLNYIFKRFNKYKQFKGKRLLIPFKGFTNPEEDIIKTYEKLEKIIELSPNLIATMKIDFNKQYTKDIDLSIEINRHYRPVAIYPPENEETQHRIIEGPTWIMNEQNLDNIFDAFID